jgi:hypothetical protein
MNSLHAFNLQPRDGTHNTNRARINLRHPKYLFLIRTRRQQNEVFRIALVCAALATVPTVAGKAIKSVSIIIATPVTAMFVAIRGDVTPILIAARLEN